MRRHSVRTRVTAGATVALLVVLVVVAVALVAAHRRTLTEDLEDGLDAAAATIAAEVEAGRLPLVLGGFGDDDAVAQVVLDGEVVAATPNVAGRGPLVEPVVGWRTVDLVDGDPFRVRTATAGEGVVHVAGSLDDVDESSEALIGSLAVAVPLAAAALAAVAWVVVGRALGPIDAIRAEVDGIDGRDLERRVTTPPTGDEVARLAATMNRMLDRVAEAAASQQHFVADAAHELRTPLTRLRTALEVDGADPVLVGDVVALQRLVDDLLLLARSDAGALEPRWDDVDLDEVVDRAAGELRAEGRVAVDTSAVDAVRVRGDRAQLARAIGNLLDNAARHARSVVDVAVGHDHDGHALVRVGDDGPGVPPEERERVFERFARVDPARSAPGGAGLGLAIARDIAGRHGGTLSIDGEADRSTFVLRLPGRLS